MKSKTLLPFAAIAIVASAVAFVLFNTTGKAIAGSPQTAPAIGAATTSTSIAVTTSTRVLATTTAAGAGYTRGYASICNPNANPVYLNLNSDAPASATRATTVIAAAAGYSVCYELTDSKMIYNGSITASSTNQTSTTLNVSEYVY